VQAPKKPPRHEPFPENEDNHHDIATMEKYRRMNYKQRASTHDFIWNNPPRRSFAFGHPNRCLQAKSIHARFYLE